MSTATEKMTPRRVLAYLGTREQGKLTAFAVAFPVGTTWCYELFTRERDAAGFAERIRDAALLLMREDGIWRMLDVPGPDGITCGEADEEATPEVCELCGDKIRSGRCRSCGWVATP